MSDKIRICEIFDSIEGEGKRAGYPVTFIRSAGCNLRCSYCDTGYSYDGGQDMTISEIMNRVHYDRVTFTGGEPLIQRHAYSLLAALSGHEVNVETNGSVDIRSFFQYPNVFFTVDYKCDSSGMSGHMFETNFDVLRKRDVLKFVVGGLDDLKQAKSVFLKHYKNLKNKMIFVSPVFGEIEPGQIVDFIKEKRLENWRIQLQLHKFIWDPEKRGV